MSYLKGFSIKPLSISATGIVSFTDGTNTIQPNQRQCEAYGYHYDEALGACVAFKTVNNLGSSIRNLRNVKNGANNVTELGTTNTQIMGENNTVKGLSRNNLIIGSNNQINNGVNNATVLGSYGQAERSGEVVIGGGGFGGAGVGRAQTSIIMLTGTTTDATVTNLFVSGDSNVTTISRDLSATSYQGFDSNIMGVRTGGTAAGSVGDRIFLNVKGLVKGKVANQSSTTTASSGTVTGWQAGVTFSVDDMTFSVLGAANMDISWSCTLNIYEIKV
mgnify:CR=1 FL=1